MPTPSSGLTAIFVPGLEDSKKDFLHGVVCFVPASQHIASIFPNFVTVLLE